MDKLTYQLKRISLLVIFLSILLSSCTSTPETPINETEIIEDQSVIFYNGIILTMDENFPQTEAIAIQGQKIIAVGTNDEILEIQETDTKVIDLHGLTVMPGFVDAHTHILNDARSQGMSLDEAQARALRNGITTLGDLFIDKTFLKQIKKFEEGLLRVRTSLYLVYNDPCGQVFGDWYTANPPTRNPGEMLRINGVKIFTDGGSCGSPALSFELVDRSGLGDLWMSQEELNQVVSEAQSLGYQVAIHAIGDRAVEQAQNAIAFALNGEPNSYRHRMEHVSVIQPEIIKRFGELDIIPVIPGIYPSCTPFGPPLPEEYGSWEWPWKDLQETNPNLHIAWHSDFPFWTTSPIIHLYGFVTRKDVYSQYTCDPQEWLKDDTFSVEQALSIMTINSAYALFREDEVGSLEVGKYADLIILSQNPLTIDEEELKNIKILMTMVNGQFEHCASEQPDLCPGYTNRVPIPLPDTRPPESVSWFIAVLIIVLPILVSKWGKTKPNLFIKIGGISGILAGLTLLIFYWALDTNPDQEWLQILLLSFMAISLVSMTLLKRSTKFLNAIFWITAFGAIVIAEGFIISVWLRQEQLWI